MAIRLAGGDFQDVRNNTLIGSGDSSQEGVMVTNGREQTVVHSNIITGFSGSGSIGLNLESGAQICAKGHNNFYDNTTDEELNGTVGLDMGNDTTTDPEIDAEYASGSNTNAAAFPLLWQSLAYGPVMAQGAVQKDVSGGGGDLCTKRLQVVGAG